MEVSQEWLALLRTSALFCPFIPHFGWGKLDSESGYMHHHFLGVSGQLVYSAPPLGGQFFEQSSKICSHIPQILMPTLNHLAASWGWVAYVVGAFQDWHLTRTMALMSCHSGIPT